MANKTCKFVTILMVMLLVLGLALVACKAPVEKVTPPAPPAATPPAATPPAAIPPAATPPATPPAAAPAAGPTSYPAATYTNDQYGFSIQYPKDWVARPEIMATAPQYLAAFGVAAFVPGVTCSVFDTPGPETNDWVIQSFLDLKSTSPKVLSDIKQETLADGTKAYTYQAGYMSATGYDIISYCLDADKDGKRIRVTVFTIDAFASYDAKLFSEVAHTLTFK